VIGEAYRRFLWHRATVRRNTTVQSATGVSKFVYSDLFTQVACNVQDAGGRMRQDENGQMSGKKLRVIFAKEWAGKFQHNDLIVVNGATFRMTHIHDSWYNGSHHVEVDAEFYAPTGDVGDAG